MRHFLLIVVAYLFLFQLARSEGYQVNLQGQKQTGMGHTGTGLLLGPSSIHFNPGALAFLEGNLFLSGGISGVFSNNSFVQNEPVYYKAESDNPVGTPFSFYGAMRLNKRLVVGLGVNSPYGNTLDWEDDWAGRYLIQNISLQAIFVQPTVSYAITPHISIGGGPVIAFGSVDLDQAIPLVPFDDGSVNLNGDATAWGYNLGAFFKIGQRLTAGINYRSKILMKVDGGDATFNVPETLSSYFPPNNTFTAELPMPANLTLGVGLKVSDKLLLAFDLQHVQWSEYNELVFDFKENTAVLEDSYNARNFENTMIYRFGAEYGLLASLKLRAGIYYDETPIPKDYLTPETPGTNKIGISGGFSWALNNHLSLDASLLHISGETRDDGYAPLEFYGRYESSAWIPGVGLSWSF